MKHLEMIKEQLIAQVQSQMEDIKRVDTKELGEVIDMIKDLAEAMYYCEIYKQMQEKETSYYTERYMPPMNMMYYPDSFQSGSAKTKSPWQSSGSSGSEHYTERDYPLYLRDEREGKSPMKRKMYMESKDMHHDSSKTMQELEDYMNELTSDMMELIDKATPDEKAALQKKIKTLSEKIQNV